MKNTTKHTPGPWKLLHHDTGQHDGDRGVYGPGNEFICSMNGGPNDDSETLANARLIAMGPELLEHLKRLVTGVNYSKVSRTDLLSLSAEAIEIIKKAEGGSI